MGSLWTYELNWLKDRDISSLAIVFLQKRRLKSEFAFFHPLIPTRLLCQMQANSSGAEFLRTISMFRKGKKTLPSLVHVLHKT